VPTVVIDVLQHTIVLSFPQKKRQPAQDTLLPGNTRRHRLYRILASAIFTVLISNKSNSGNELKEFRTATLSLHLCFDSTRRDTSRIISRRKAEMIRQPEHIVENGQGSTGTIVPKAVYREPKEWDERVRLCKERHIRAEAETNTA
jgi:hypothetical protein